MLTDMNSYTRQRLQLKSLLLSERQKIFNGRYLPICAYCGRGIEGAADLHEVLFSKGDVSGVEHLSGWINNRCNCVLVHAGGNASPCHSGITSEEGQLRAIRQIVFWEDINIVLEYIRNTQDVMKGDQPEQARLLVVKAMQK